ncbi:MAG: hypothetical protein KDA70_14830 [Planctomycetaceae bacterium]|nr:hypothetical protein [Planctomycetaceae bacterium]
MSNAYVIFDPKVDRPLHEMPRKDAKAAYNWFIAQKDERVEVLKRYAHELGFSLDDEFNAIEQLHDLLVAEIHKDGVRDVPTPRVFSLCNDIAIFISEMLIRNESSLQWTFYIANKNDLSYHRPVITGFNVKNKFYSVDIDYVLCQYAHRLSQGGSKEEGLLRRIYESAISKADRAK